MLSVRLPILQDVKGSNADNSHRSHQRISCQFSDSAPSQQFATVPRRLRIQRCIYCNVTYCDPRHMQWHFTYYKCLRVLCRDTFNTYKAAQKHQQQNPGHVCLSKTSAEHRALTRSRIPIPLISEPVIRMVRVSTTSTITLPLLPHSSLSCRHHCSSQNHSNLVQAFQLLVDR